MPSRPQELFAMLDDFLAQTYTVPVSEPFADASYYANWLSQHYYYIRHTTRLLALAASKLDPSDRLHHRFLEHAAEERGHEKLILRDLKALGFSLESFEEYPATAQLYQAQYFLIENVSPLSLLGYPLFLEALSCHVGPSIYGLTQSTFGEAASNFIRVHAEQDEDHLETLRQVLEQLPPEACAQVEWSLRQTFSSYKGVLSALQAAHQAEGRNLRPLKKLKAA